MHKFGDQFDELYEADLREVQKLVKTKTIAQVVEYFCARLPSLPSRDRDKAAGYGASSGAAAPSEAGSQPPLSQSPAPSSTPPA